MTAPIWITPPGQIGSTLEGSSFIYNLLYTTDEAVTFELISGNLPPGLTLNTNTGAISGITGLISGQTTYEFTIRLTNASGFADNGFFITIENITPTWNNPSDLGSFAPDFYASINFSVNDPGGTTQTFEKISGTFPPGFSLNSFGNLYGIVEDITALTVYNFTIRAFLDGTFIDQEFTLTIDPSYNSAPIWLTPAGSLGNIIAGETFSQLLLAESPQGFQVTYSTLPSALPFNLSLNTSTCVISGILSSSESIVYTFPVTATASNQSTTRIFSLNANSAIVYSIEWVTPTGNIGTINEGDKSTLSVSASSLSPYLRYVVSSGSLPPGLTLDIVTGQIWGVAQIPNPQIIGPTTYTFTVDAYDEDTSLLREFSITVNNTYAPGATRVYAALYGNNKLLFNDLFNTSEVLLDDIYRQGDPNYSLIRVPKILIVENLNVPSADQVFDALSGVRRTYLTFGKVLVGQAVVNNEVIYEVLYRRIFDSSAGAAESVTTLLPPQPAGTPAGVTVHPGSLINIRNELIAAFGSSGGSDNLPLWMQSEQTIGDSTTIPGYVPCLEFAYVKPGTGAAIAANINANDVQLKKMFGNRVRTDRIVIEPAADNSFVPKNILFDNSY
jgi:hypothetical protein